MLTKSGKRIVSFGLVLAVTGSCFAGILSDPASTQAAKKSQTENKVHDSGGWKEEDDRPDGEEK